jgi:hypothetical protein
MQSVFSTKRRFARTISSASRLFQTAPLSGQRILAYHSIGNSVDGDVNNIYSLSRSQFVEQIESVQRFADVEKAKGVYHGINMKLMKSAGMHEGYRIIMKAKELGLKTMIGCMSETSCGTLAAAALAPLCDWADLDGPFLTSNNPYKDPEFIDGKWVLSDIPGLGLMRL